MKLSKIPIKDIRFEKKLQTFTYGLLYPAFFGNMIYDILQAYTQDGRLKGIEISIAVLIVLLNAVDYAHLFTDVDELAGKKGVKDWIYIGCDIVASFLFFSAFVALKYQHIYWSFLLFSLIPVSIGFYKQLYFTSDSERNWVKWCCIITVLLSLGLLAWFRVQQQPELLLKLFLVFGILELLTYIYYVFWFMPAAVSKVPPIHPTDPAVAHQATPVSQD